MPVPLFVCHANCARSVLAYYLYRHLCHGAPALSAGLQGGDGIDSAVDNITVARGREDVGERGERGAPAIEAGDTKIVDQLRLPACSARGAARFFARANFS